MAENPFAQTETAQTAAPVVDRAFVAQSDPVVMSGANWFWWIAALTVVNTVMIHSGSDRNFVIGLGFTLLADAIFKNVILVALIIDVVSLTIFCGLGFLTRKGYLWAFITGIVLYALDTLIYVLGQDWMSVAFHGLALFYMIRGARALRAALKEAAEPVPEVAPPPLTPS